MTDPTFAAGEQVREYGEKATEITRAFGRQAIDTYEQVVKPRRGAAKASRISESSLRSWMAQADADGSGESGR
jgi:hypothetical protein